MAEQLQVQPFGVKFDEAITHLKSKLSETTAKWDSLAGPVHAKVFTIAGATNVDLVKDIHQSLSEALVNGTSLSKFRTDFAASVQKHGWAYQGSFSWRTALIFNTNMRTAHMAGRWQQLQANREARPYLEYRTAGDARVRPLHKAWDGLIYKIDDSFWDTHYPPCGYNCRCTIRAFGDTELADRGLKVAQKFPLQYRDVVDATGAVTDTVPVGIDPGWDHNVGKSWITPELALGKKLANLPLEVRGPMVDKTISPAFQTVLNSNFKAFKEAIKRPQGQAQIVGFLDSATIEAVAGKLPSNGLLSTAVTVLDNKTKHLTGSHKAETAPLQVWPTDWINNLPENMRNYRALLWDTINNTLVVIPQGSFNDSIPKITIRLNQKTKLGTAASVVSLGSAQQADLSTAQYQLLRGKL